MSNVIPAKPKAKRSGDGFKYFNELQIKLIRRTVRDAAQLAKEKGQVTAIRQWALIDLLTSTGMREAEAANLRCGDIIAGYGQSACYVRSGKGDKSRTIQIPDSLRTHLKSFLTWKQEKGEAVGQDDYLFVGQRGNWTPWAVGEIVKKYLRQLGLYENGKSAHSLRHYAEFRTMPGEFLRLASITALGNQKPGIVFKYFPLAVFGNSWPSKQQSKTATEEPAPIAAAPEGCKAGKRLLP